MVKKHNPRGGFTLVELMVIISVLAVVMTIAPSLLKTISRFSLLNDARLETQRDVREALNQINQSLRQASAASVEISEEASQPPYSKITFSTVDGRTIGFYQTGTDLNFVSNGSTRTLSSNLRYLAFAPPKTEDPNIIAVSVTFEKGTYEGQTKSLQLAIEKVRIMND